jgi:DMSO/TMAO reductase YedYZ molybdopterin-dependent catalytic subunit
MAAACLGFSQAPPSAATLSVAGDVTTPLTLTSDDVAKLPRKKISALDPSGNQAEYEGVLLGSILKRAGVPLGEELRGKALSTYVLAKAHDGYQVVFTVAELDPQLGDQTILVADRVNGKPLSKEEGPFRLVLPNDKAPARWVRGVETLEIVRLRK